MANSPHDKLFKSVFSDPSNAVAHFTVCLPPELVSALDLSKAQHLPGSWVDEALRDRHSDVVHSVPFRSTGATDGQTVSVLLHTIWEHQSTVDEMMSWRAHRYSSRLLEDWSREHPGQRLPPVIVLVLYHGQAEWTAPEELEELFALDGVTAAAREALRPYLPKQRYLLEVVPEDPAQMRSGPGIARLTLITLKLGRTAGRWTVIFERKGSRKNNFGIRPPIHQFCQRRSSVKYVNVFALLAS